MVDSEFAYDGLTARELASRCGVPLVVALAEAGSTLDVAHDLAEKGAAHGTVVVADAQLSGRGRMGRRWSSAPGCGVWCTVLERPVDTQALEVLSLRVGLAVAVALDAVAGEQVGLKWPNDLVVASNAVISSASVIPAASVIPSVARDLQFRKLGGILTEARWSGSTLAWVAIGAGVNLQVPADIPKAAGLPRQASRVDVLERIVRAIRSAAAEQGSLTRTELKAYAERDILVGRRILAPAAGIVRGVDASGALLVETQNGVELHRAGTIELAEDT